jgi:hypothetical protein
MPRHSAAIVIRKGDSRTSLYRELGGRPETFVHFLSAAISGNRKRARASPGKLSVLISATAPRIFEVMPSDTAIDLDHEWRYEIDIRERDIFLTLTHIDTDDTETIVYSAARIENFISKALRNPRMRDRPPGRIPRGYQSRAEYAATRAARKAVPEAPPAPNQNLRDAILADRKLDPPTKSPDFSGLDVKPISLDEMRRRRGDRRRTRRTDRE